MKNSRANTSATQRTGRARVGVRGAPQYRVVAGEGDRGDERVGDALLGVDGRVDSVGHRGQEPLGFPPDQPRDQIVAARIAPVGGHPGDAGPAHHVLDGEALQPDGCRLLQRGIQQPLAGAVGGFVDPATGPGAADDDDEVGVDHRATTSGSSGGATTN